MGLDWLARHQADDGHWSDQGKCTKSDPCPSSNKFNYGTTIAETGLAVLAFQAGGHYDFNQQKYSDNVKRGLDWLVKQQNRGETEKQEDLPPMRGPRVTGRFANRQTNEDGCLFGPVQTWYEHGMATFALAEACAVSRAERQKPDPRYLDAAQQAVKFMERHQYKQGGWQYDLDSPRCGDTSVTGWQILALKSAQEAKIKVDPATMQRVGQFFENCGDPATGRTGYMNRGGGTDLALGVGLIVQEFILKKRDSELARNAIRYLEQRARGEIGGQNFRGEGRGKIGESGDFYTLYNCTLAMFLAGGDHWKKWNNEIRDAVVSRQVKGGCARGSWDDIYGRTLGTAWAVLTLEVYYRYAKLPGSQRN